MTELIAAAPEDCAALAEYLGAFDTAGERDFWRSRFRLWWDANPAFTPRTPRGWTLRESGKIVGFLGNIPSRMRVANAERTVHSVTTWMVDEGRRDRSLELLMRQMRLAGDTLLFDTTPTDLVDEILRSLGFTPLPWGEDKESFVLLDPAACVEALLPGLPGAALAAKAAGAPLGLLQNLRRDAAPAMHRIARVRRAGAEFDELWRRTESAFATTNVRTAEVLRWHCAEDDKIEKRLYGCYAQEELTGYAVMRVRSRRGLRTLECVDLWPDGFAGDADLIAFIAESASLEGFQLLTLPHFSRRLGERFRELGLFARPLARKNLYLVPGALEHEGLEEGSYFVGLQGDYGTAGP